MRRALVMLVFLSGVTPSRAQDSPETRLRELLRRSTADLRAAQDSQAWLQGQLDQEKQKTVALQKQIDDLTAQQATRPAVSAEETARTQAAAQTQVTNLQAGLKQWQDAYQKAVELARVKDAEGKSLTIQAAENHQQVVICSAANRRLIGVANDILHLYQTQSFRALLIDSYEPLLGLKKVELENTIQDYEDKIDEQKYRPGRPQIIDTSK